MNATNQNEPEWHLPSERPRTPVFQPEGSVGSCLLRVAGALVGSFVVLYLLLLFFMAVPRCSQRSVSPNGEFAFEVWEPRFSFIDRNPKFLARFGKSKAKVSIQSTGDVFPGGREHIRWNKEGTAILVSTPGQILKRYLADEDGRPVMLLVDFAGRKTFFNYGWQQDDDPNRLTLDRCLECGFEVTETSMEKGERVEWRKDIDGRPKVEIIE